jgi:OFA family oxalate/formate antiporter-like MFS transporter
MVVIIPSITALCNALGRIGYSTISDKMKDRATVYKIIFISSMCMTSFTLNSIQFNWLIAPILVILLLIIINAGYGGGFSTLPALLSQNFGMNNISKIHGIALTAWAIAGITGNNLSEIVLKNSNNNYKFLLPITIVLYFISLMCSFNASKKVKTN